MCTLSRDPLPQLLTRGVETLDGRFVQHPTAHGTRRSGKTLCTTTPRSTTAPGDVLDKRGSVEVCGRMCRGGLPSGYRKRFCYSAISPTLHLPQQAQGRRKSSIAINARQRSQHEPWMWTWSTGYALGLVPRFVLCGCFAAYPSQAATREHNTSQTHQTMISMTPCLQEQPAGQRLAPTHTCGTTLRQFGPNGAEAEPAVCET